MGVEVMEKFIELKHVNRSYGVGDSEFFALSDVDLTINQGEFVVILGPSGAGKSTLLNLLGGMDSPSSGEILINKTNITNFNDNQLTDFRAKNIGFIFQFYNLIPSLTAYENIALIKDVVDSCLPPEMVLKSVGLENHLKKFPAELSGGEQQRVSIARAIVKQPLMLLCDEPTGALDSSTGEIVLSLLQKISREEGKTVIVVTHNDLVAPCADTVINMKNGKIQEVINNQNPLLISEVNW